MHLLPNDIKLLQSQKLYYLLHKISPSLRIDENAERVLLDFVNEYVEDLMGLAMDVDEARERYQARKTLDTVNHQNKTSTHQHATKEKFSDVDLLDMAQELIGKWGLRHSDVRRDLFVGQSDSHEQHDENGHEEKSSDE